MKKSEKLLLLQALEGEAAAFRKLALLIKDSGENHVEQRLCRILFNKAIELGDEESFILYHQMFPEEDAQFDRDSYEDMLADYHGTKDLKEKEKLKRYLTLMGMED